MWTAWATGLLGDGDRLARYWEWMNPAWRAGSREGMMRYRGEPYVVAADVSTSPLHHGGAGWTWYTGSASWMYRLGMEVMLGLRKADGCLFIDPCIPSAWDGFSASWRVGQTTYDIEVRNPGHVCRGVATISLDGRPLGAGGVPLTEDGKRHRVNVVLGGDVSV